MQKTSIKKVNELEEIILLKNRNSLNKICVKKMEKDFFELCICKNLIKNKTCFYKFAKLINK